MNPSIIKPPMEGNICYQEGDTIPCIALRHLEEIGIEEHKASHEAWIKARKAEEEFWNSLKKEIIAKGISGVLMLLIIILGLAWTGLLTKIGVR